MPTAPITLSRDDWTRLHDGLDAIRAIPDALFDIPTAMLTLGQTAAALRLIAGAEAIAAQTIALAEILTQADDSGSADSSHAGEW